MAQVKILRSDYQNPQFQILKTHLHFNILNDFTIVTSDLLISLNPNIAHTSSITLNGDKLELLSVEMENSYLPPTDYEVSESQLTILRPKKQFRLKTQVKLYPDTNTNLEGLYQSGTNLLTQCEPEGFRRITFYADRPDVMSLFEVEIEADLEKYPTLLSNGNLITQSQKDRRLFVKWVDPFFKPSYLFALVAGDFDLLEDQFVTRSGRLVSLKFYVKRGNKNKSQFALDSLKKAMKWDEDRFGLEYDLDTYMIVATDDFNAGAMENKGLNVFNSRLVLSDTKSSTDDNYFAIESVVAHEYFHNWSGNRVTLRDWFNLSLKEGLTVFRDQEFSMDLHSPTLVRIETVQALRAQQFSEDGGPNSHPVYPEYGYAVDNFFTATIYEKGAEIIRMLQTLTGRPAFNSALKAYFKKYDGKSVTIEDFTDSIFDSTFNSQGPLIPFKAEQFKLWYSQSGTPRVSVTVSYDKVQKSYHLYFNQITHPTLNQAYKKALVIPMVTTAYIPTGEVIKLDHSAFFKNTENQSIFIMTKEAEKIEIGGLGRDDVLFSFNQGFSSPIILDYDLKDTDLIKLFHVENDGLNKWDIAQTIYLKAFRSATALPFGESSSFLPEPFLLSLGALIENEEFDRHLLSLLLELPSESYLVQRLEKFEAETFSKIKNQISKQIAHLLGKVSQNRYLQLYNKNVEAEFSTQAMADRKLKNQLLILLQPLLEGENLAFKQYSESSNMTDQEAAFRCCLNSNAYRDQVKLDFFESWRSDSLTLNKWFQSLAASSHHSTNQTVRELWLHPEFNKNNPNRVYSLLRAWGQNLTHFHANVNNYDWMLERCRELDKINPQVAARIAQVFDLGPYLNSEKKAYLKNLTKKMLTETLSPNLYEILLKVQSAL